MGLLDHTFNQTCEVITTTQNEYGDQIEVAREEWACRIREITQIQSVGNREDVSGADAMLWISPDAPVAEGALIESDSMFWRVSKVTKARRFTSEIIFLKCLLEKHNGPTEEEDGEDQS